MKVYLLPVVGGKWSISTTRSILSNEKYKGCAVLQKTYTEDFLTKKAKKNNGEKPKYMVENSHDAIISEEVFERVQRELERRRTYTGMRSGKNKDASVSDKKMHPFSSRIICEDCGSYYGHKVWRSRGKNRNRYDVWYCNHRYDYEKGHKCNTPILREDDIKESFKRMVKILNKDGSHPLYEVAYDEALWWELIESVTLTSKNKAKFLLNDGRKITVSLPKAD